MNGYILNARYFVDFFIKNAIIPPKIGKIRDQLLKY